MSMKARLIAAKALIADIKNWMQHDYARTVGGRMVRPNHEAAECFCALGAVSRQNDGRLSTEDAMHMNTASRGAFGKDWSVIRVNDEIGHEAVLKVFDRAIETAPN